MLSLTPTIWASKCMYPRPSGTRSGSSGTNTAMLLLLLSAALGFATVASLPHGGEAEGQSSGNCPANWVDASFVDMGCLYFNSTAALSWEDASSLCQMGSGSTLLAITSEIQMDFIHMQLDVITDHDGAFHYWWTAGTNATPNDEWLWWTYPTYSPVEDYVWSANYPDGNQNNKCLVLEPGANEYHGINKPCWNVYYPICQLK